MITKLIAIVLLPALSPTAIGAPDEVRLHDGRVLVGKVVKRGDDLVIKTRDGDVLIAASDVASRRTDKELRAALRDLAKDRPESGFTSLQLAETARTYGLDKEMWRHLDACVEHVGDERESAVARRLGDFLAGLEGDILPAERLQAEAVVKARGLLRRVRTSTKAGLHAAILELLVRMPGIDDELRRRVKIEPLPEQRLTALQALVRRDASNVRLAEHRTVHDKDDDLRREAAQIIGASDDPAGAVQRLIPGLLNDQPLIRKRTAEAYANIGEESAIPVLVRAGPYAGTPRRRGNGHPGTRSHMFSTTTRSFIKDFDVEIAQAAAVANPIIGNVREGVVLDVTVAAVVTQRVRIESAYRQALKRLAGSDPGRDPSKWAAWLAAQRSAAQRGAASSPSQR